MQPSRGARVCLLAGLLATLALADDLGKQMLDAAAQGRAAGLSALLAKGAPLEAKDKTGRTPLMLAAQRGHAGVVRVLLEKGADPAVRDQAGATAWVLATFSPAGNRDGNAEVLKLLPSPPRLKLAVEANWNTGNVYNSCVMRLEQLTRFLGEIQPDQLALNAFRRYSNTPGLNTLEVGSANARGVAAPEEEAFAEADAVLVLTVHPGVACVPQQAADRLSLTLEVQLLRAKDRVVLLHKSIGGGGLKALHARMVTGQWQYVPVFDEWIRSYAQGVYLAVAEAWYRTG